MLRKAKKDVSIILGQVPMVTIAFTVAPDFLIILSFWQSVSPDFSDVSPNFLPPVIGKEFSTDPSAQNIQEL